MPFVSAADFSQELSVMMIGVSQVKPSLTLINLLTKVYQSSFIYRLLTESMLPYVTKPSRIVFLNRCSDGRSNLGGTREEVESATFQSEIVCKSSSRLKQEPNVFSANP